MRFAFAIFRYFPFGGLQLDMLRIACAAVKRGHSVTVFTGDWIGDVPEGISVRVIPLSSLSNHGKAKEFEAKFRKILSSESFDRTCAFNRMDGTGFYFAGDDCLAASYSARHSALFLSLIPRYRTMLAMERSVFRPDSPAQIMLITRRQFDDYIRCYGTPPERMHLLPPGIDEKCRRTAQYESIRRELREKLNLTPESFLLVMVATNFSCKGGDRVLEAVNALPEEWKKRCKIYFLGTEDPGGKNPVRNQSFFLGKRRDVERFLFAADLMVHPARNEAAGSVLLEALAAGLPVIASERCGFSGYVREAGCPVIPEPFRQEILNETLKEVLTGLSVYRERVFAYSVPTMSRAEFAVNLLEK